MKEDKIQDFLVRFQEFKASENYSNRIEQAAIIPYFRRIIKAAIVEETISNQTLTDLIQIQKHNCTN